MLTAALKPIIAKTGMQIKVIDDRGIDKQNTVYICTMEYYSATQWSTIQP